MSLTLIKKPEYEFGDGLFSRWNAIHQQEGVKFEYQRKDMNVSAWQDDAGQLKITIPSAAGLSIGDFIYLCDDDNIYTPGFYEIDDIDGALLTLILPWNGEPSGGFANSDIRFPNYNVLAEIYTIREDILGKNLLTNGDFSSWDTDNPKYWTVIGESGADPEVSQVGSDEGHGGAGTGSCNLYTSAAVTFYIYQDILTIGKYYLIEIEITKIISGDIHLRIGNSGTREYLSTEGIHRFIGVCAENGLFIIRRSDVPCDITIDNVSVKEIGSSKELIFTPDTTGLVKVDSVSVLKMISSFVEESAYDTVNIRDAEASGRFKVRVKEQWTGSSESWSSYTDLFYHTNSARQLKDKYGKNMYDYVLKEKNIDIVKSYFSTNERGCPIFVLYGYATSSPQFYYHNKKTYGVWMQRGGIGYGLEPMVFAVYHCPYSVSESYGCRPGRPAGEDTHAFPSIIIASDGHIIVAHLQLKNDDPNSGHGSMIEIKRSDNPEDETSWEHAYLHDADYYTTVGNNTTEHCTYPKLYKLTNGNIILFSRFQGQKVKLWASTDHGKTFNAGTEIVDLTASHAAYNFQPTRGVTSQIDVIVRRYNRGTLKTDEAYYLRSRDGGTTWTDVAGGGSKDVVASGALTLAELQANKYRICSDVTNGNGAYNGIMIDNDTPYILVMETLATRYLNIYEYSSGAWNQHQTGLKKDDAYCETIFGYRDDNFDIIIKRIVGFNFVIKRYRANISDLTDWSLVEDNIFKRPSTEMMSLNLGQYTFNATLADYRVFGKVIDHETDYNDFYLYAEMCASFTKFLAKFTMPTIFINYPWDISIIYSDLLADMLLILKEVTKDINGNEDYEYWTPLDGDEKLYINRIVQRKIIISSYAFIDLSIILTGEESLLNNEFIHWNGTEDPDDWTTTETLPNSEIEETFNHIGHLTGVGHGACNIYSLAGVEASIKQNILTLGKLYAITVFLTWAESGSIKVIMGTGGSEKVLSTIDTHNFVLEADGSSTDFIIRNDGACDITIDVVSVKEYHGEISEVKNVIIDQECKDNPIYLRWVNLLGAREYWLFSHHQEYGLEIDNIELIERNISNIETADAIQDIISKEAKESIIIGEDNLQVSNVEGMKGLLLSPLVQMLTNPALWENDSPKWKTVIVKKNTWNLYRNDRGTYSLELEIGLPKLNIQTR